MALSRSGVSNVAVPNRLSLIIPASDLTNVANTEPSVLSVRFSRVRRAPKGWPFPLLMLWTAPPPARECHGCGRLLMLPRFRGAQHEDNHNHRARSRQVGLSSSRG